MNKRFKRKALDPKTNLSWLELFYGGQLDNNKIVFTQLELKWAVSDFLIQNPGFHAFSVKELTYSMDKHIKEVFPSQIIKQSL